MALVTFPYNGTSGTTCTTGNTGAFSIATGTNSTQTLQSGAAYQGSTGARFVSDGTASSGLRHRFTGSVSASQASFSIRFKVPASAPSASINFLQVNDTTATRILQLQYTSTGLVKINDKSNTSTTILTAAQATAGTWFRLELVVTNLSATAGAFTARAYSTGSTQVGSTASSSTANTGTTAIDGAYAGIIGAVAATVDVDSLQMNDGSTSEIGEYTPNTTQPTLSAVTATPQTTTPSTLVNLSATGTAYNGDSIASYSWSFLDAFDNTGATIAFPTITNPTTSTPSFTTAAGKYGRYRLQVTTTDTSGNTSTASVLKVFVPNAAGVPIEVTTATGFATTTPSNVNDASDSTYAESGGVGSGSVVVYRLSPLTAATSAFSLDVRSMVQAAGGTQQVELLEGATVRKNWGALSPGTSMADQILTLTTAEMATIGSWNELDLRFTQV